MNYSLLIIPDGEMGPHWVDFSGSEAAAIAEMKRIGNVDGFHWTETRLDKSGLSYTCHFYISPAHIQLVKMLPSGTDWVV